MFSYIVSILSPSKNALIKVPEHGYSQSSIDCTLNEYKIAARELCFLRNTMTCIARLPPELLSTIFLLVCAPDQGSPGLDWIKVSHICRHWRSVALGCASLWCRPMFTFPLWVEEMLIRSKSAPLVIEAQLTHLMAHYMLEAVESALQNIQRIKILDLASPDDIFDELVHPLTHPAPLLNSLRLHRMAGSGKSAPVLSPNFLGGEVPQLRNLELIRCPISWDSMGVFSNLTRLIIAQGEDAGYRPSLKQMRDILETMPELEVLELDNCLPTFPDYDSAGAVVSGSTSMPLINLPHLSRLSLCSETFECSNILDQISFPPAATLKLNCMGTTASNFDFNSILPALVRWLSCPSGSPENSQPHLQWLRITQLYEPRVRFVGLSSYGTGTAWSFLTTPHMLLDLSSSDWNINLEDKEILASVCTALPLTHLKIIDLEITITTFDAQKWIGTFGSLQELHTIKLRSHLVWPLIRPLIQALSCTKSDSTMHFQGLRHLLLDDADFGRVEDQLLERFKDCLIMRIEQGMEIWSLTFRKCRNLHAHNIKELRELVVDVNWDCYWESTAYEEAENNEGGPFGGTTWLA